MKECTRRRFYKTNPEDIIRWVDDGTIGPLEISFNKRKIYNLRTDYPQKFTKEELEIFNKENPFWADFFRNRLNEAE